MWTREELKCIRDNAELSAKSEKSTFEWRAACLEMAVAAIRLDYLVEKIESGEIRAVKDDSYTSTVQRGEK
jgi:hypothetical protein